jgi:hypothetical protein
LAFQHRQQVCAVETAPLGAGAPVAAKRVGRRSMVRLT